MTTPSRSKRLLAHSAKLIGPLLLVLIWQGNSELIHKTLSSWSPTLVLLAAVLYVPYAVLRVVRWRLLLRIQGIEYGFRTSFRIYYATSFLGMLTPGRVGELSRLSYLQRDHGVPRSKALAGVVVDRLHDLAMLLLISSGLLLVPDLQGIVALIWCVATFASLALLFPFVGNLLLGLAPLSRSRREGLRDWLAVYHTYLLSFATRAHFAPILVTGAGALLYAAMMAILQRAVGVNLSMDVAGGVGALGTLASMLPISFLGIGTRDAAIAGTYIALGVGHPAASAIAYSALYLVFFSGISSCAGFVAYQMDPLHAYYLRSRRDC